jgi:hypothetical protein
MPRLLRGIARTAVIAGTATAVSNNVSRRQGDRWAAQQAQQQPEPVQQYAPPPPAAAATAAPSSSEDRIEALQGLAALKEQGVLTDAEFAAEKARILQS